ncbi:SusC/RagA family TonB-linked outer membrane protein [Persicobacter diffluens]|uniref:SusC/RagA family TonB-linked outer membrane protein n=1 Tax=Persicobacter diffluens TaxID=981 RepID=A0AAN5AMA6_9BACT|nr:SusC/RagA family TonB-linked outer membrane protein [Persicobacter diffluens]
MRNNFLRFHWLKMKGEHRLRKMYLLLLFVLSPLFLHPTFAQKQIEGLVTDPSGFALPGVNLIIEGTSQGTTTDQYGKFILKLPDGKITLLVSYVGYKEEKILVGNQSMIEIILKEDTETLEEVVVVGYGTVKKSDLTGSIIDVEAKTLTERGTTSPVQALQGAVAGVQINNSTGVVGDNFSITIRGKNTLQDGANSPLFVVDGAIVDNIDFLNPQDIAKMDILKDASSAAIYGSRATNGVVIITTKKGNAIPSGTSITFDSFVGIKTPARLPKMMGSEKWQEYHMSAYLATVSDLESHTPESFYDAVLPLSSNEVLRQRFDDNYYFDWYDAVLKNGIQTNNNVNLTHRNGGSAYTLSLGHQKETGVIENEGIEKLTLRLGMDQEFSKSLKIGANITLAHTEIEQGSSIAMQEAFRLSPMMSPYAIDDNHNEIDGELFLMPGKLTDPSGTMVVNKTSTINPLLEIANSHNVTKDWNLLTNAYVDYKATDWLSFRSAFSSSLRSSRQGLSWGSETQNGTNNGGLPMSEIIQNENFNYTWDNQFNINKEVGIHRFNFLGLQSIFVDRYENSLMSSREQPFDTEFYNVGSGQQGSFYMQNGFQKFQLASFAARLNYALNEKYLLTLTNRWDGSSQLALGNKWASFPSAAVAWKLKSEDFMQDLKFVSDLKVRVSYGVTGNNNVAAYSSMNALTAQSYYNYGAKPVTGWSAATLANKNLGWETTSELNFGLDFSLLDHRIRGSIDIYNRLSDDLLVDQKLPLETGFEIIRANAASVRNKGAEIMLTTTNIKTAKVTWETIFTFSKNVNSIESIYGQSEEVDIGNGWFIGQPIDVHYNYQFDGVWHAHEKDQAESYNQTEGEARVKDINNDGAISPDDDRVFLGSSNPDWTGGIISRLNVGNWDMGLTISTQQGVLAYSPFHENFNNVRDRGRQKLDWGEWYVPENNVGVRAQNSNVLPQPRNEGTYWRNDGVGYYHDASFVKINNISIGYTFPASTLEKVKLSNLRVYANVLNPFVFSAYDGWDPEWAEADLGVGRVSTVVYQMGLNVKF